MCTWYRRRWLAGSHVTERQAAQTCGQPRALERAVVLIVLVILIVVLVVVLDILLVAGLPHCLAGGHRALELRICLRLPRVVLVLFLVVLIVILILIIVLRKN